MKKQMLINDIRKLDKEVKRKNIFETNKKVFSYNFKMHFYIISNKKF